MSCHQCEVAQNEPETKKFYFRWKNANIQIVACNNHAAEIMEALKESDPRRLIEQLLSIIELKTENQIDTAKAYVMADEAIVNFINNPGVSAAYDEIKKMI